MASKIFSGYNDVKVDAKCRIAISSKSRELLGETFHISLALDHCLTIIDTEGFERTSRMISAKPFSTSSKIARRLNAFSFEVKTDKQGRIVIPPQLRNALSIEPGDELVVAGVGANIEVWHKDEFYAAMEITDEEYAKYADVLRFGDTDIGESDSNE